MSLSTTQMPKGKVRPEHIGAPLKTPPGPRGHFLLGNVLQMQRDSLSFFIQLARDYGDIVQTRMLSQPCYMLFHPDYVKHVLQENNTNYDRNHTVFHVMKQFTGNGLATIDGPSWLHQRRLIQPAFHRQRIASLGAIMTSATEAMLQHWETLSRQDTAMDIPEEMFNLTLRIVGQALFSTDLSDEENTTSRAFRSLLTLLARYLFLPFPPLSVPTPYNLRLRAAFQRINKIIYGIIHERRRQETDKEDLLSMLLAVRDEETGEGMSDVQLRDEVMTMLLAGHETTANTLNWTWYLLALHPEVEQRLHAEIDGTLNGRVPTVANLPRLPYTRMVIEESMRFYPAVVGIPRHAIAEDEIGGYRIRANSQIWLSPYVTHHYPDFWDHPEVFDPERFTPERSAGRPRYAYFPFGGGPHQCIGNTFSMMEAHLILATVAQRYRLRLAPGSQVTHKVVLAIQPTGLHMLVEKRI